MTASISTDSVAPKAFGALALRGYRAYLLTFMLTMMADNIEHVISYWVVFQKFHSPALGGFAVVSHWLPFLAFSVAIGALNDRLDSRRLIQAGAVLFIVASAGWGYFFVTDTLQMWHAMVLLVIHGCAGVLWVTSSQMLLYDIVGPAALPSAVRLAATARYLGVLVGPGVGSVVMLTLGPTRGIFFNTVFYLPLLLWLIAAPYGRHFRGGSSAPKRAVRGFADIVQTIREVRTIPLLATMILLVGGASFFIGNSYQAQMPGFANDLGHGDPGTAYTMLLAADAAGALLAGIVLESRGGIFKMSPGAAAMLAMGWSAALFGFALVHTYALAIALLFLAGFFELSFSSMAQTLVQMHAPEATRGRVLGLYNMAAAGLRAFSGITVGLVGSIVSVHTSLAVAAGAFVSVSAILFARLRATTT
ncbi:MFS transporter [Pendulispora rubella]|uniref:MFS transporter n=1 Tax=Pendulispora rubella TaxID=2741070 RepID=A0ABZ2KYK4_9BACT